MSTIPLCTRCVLAHLRLATAVSCCRICCGAARLSNPPRAQRGALTICSQTLRSTPSLRCAWCASFTRAAARSASRCQSKKNTTTESTTAAPHTQLQSGSLIRQQGSAGQLHPSTVTAQQREATHQQGTTGRLAHPEWQSQPGARSTAPSCRA